MITDYLVIGRQELWWIMVHGVRNGPHGSQQAAVDIAFVMARLDHKAGREASVSIEKEHGFEQIYAPMIL